MVLKQLFFQKITKNLPVTEGCAPRPHSLLRLRAPPPDLLDDAFELQHTSLLNTPPNLDFVTF